MGMTFGDLQVIASFIGRAVCPEDVFGQPPATVKDKQQWLKQEHRKLAKVLHPDGYNGDAQAVVLANSLFQELETFKKAAMARITAGTYGNKKPLSGKAPVIVKSKYVREGTLCAGDMADLHIASLESSPGVLRVLLKVARSANDNDLLKAEAEALERLHEKLSSQWAQCVPEIRETFLLDKGHGFRTRVNVMERFDGFLDGTEIAQRIPQGVDGKTLVWMWKRLLVLLDWTYSIGFVHGAVLPPHVMFYPDNDGGKVKDIRKHSIRLVDWCYAIEHRGGKRTRLSAWAPKWAEFYAPEVRAKETLGSWTDLYMGAKTILYLAGGNTETNRFPKEIPTAIADKIKECLYKDPRKRPQNTEKYFDEFTKVVRGEYGAPRFHEFIVPGK